MFVDAKYALDPYAEKLGVDTDEPLVSQPDAGEQALEITDMLVRSGAVDVVVVDSVAALTRAPRSKATWATPVGLQARLMSQALRAHRQHQTVELHRHLHQPDPHENRRHVRQPETTTGAMRKFYAPVRLDIRRIGAIKKGR